LTDRTDHHPLRRVRLRNFKSVVEADIELAPLTVLLGANSSGKSSILQALLALHQVAASDSPLSTFSLNGPKSSLGYFDQALSQSARAREIEIGVDLRLRVADVVPVPSLLDDWSFFSKLRTEATDVRYSVQFSEITERGDEAASPSITAVSVLAKNGDDQAKLAIQLKYPKKGFISGSTIMSSSWYAADLQGRFDEGFRGSLQGAASHKVTGVSFTGGVPTSLAATARGPAVGRLFADIALSILDRFSSRGPDVKVTAKDVRRVAACVVSAMVPWAEQAPRDSAHASIVNDVIDELRHREVMEKAMASVANRRDDLWEAIRKAWPTSSEVRYLLVGKDAQLIAHAATQSLGFLSSHAFYLAGLRVAPQALYPFTPLPSDSDIGTRGENLASVLITIGDREVRCPNDDGTISSRTLKEALTSWVRKLGLLEDVQPLHRGAQGHALQVRHKASEEPLDLSAVGVGVSQVIPVLVQCLLAEPGDLVLLEQPELHLHPAAQLQLADFLLACVRSGRQIVVETHSEHLVNRLRRRVAEADSDELSRVMSLVFAERNTEGVTTYQPVEVSPVGGLVAWPSGFFPEGADEMRSLLEAGLRKQAHSLHADE
jgi:predicted ATPase